METFITKSGNVLVATENQSFFCTPNGVILRLVRESEKDYLTKVLSRVSIEGFNPPMVADPDKIVLEYRAKIGETVNFTDRLTGEEKTGVVVNAWRSYDEVDVHLRIPGEISLTYAENCAVVNDVYETVLSSEIVK